MRTAVDEQLVEEAKRYALRYTCECCVHFTSDKGECSLEYPNEAHREVPLTVGASVVFCKEFDLV